MLLLLEGFLSIVLLEGNYQPVCFDNRCQANFTILQSTMGPNFDRWSNVEEDKAQAWQCQF